MNVRNLNEVIKKTSFKHKSYSIGKGKNLKTSKTGAKGRVDGKAKKGKIEEKVKLADCKEVKNLIRVEVIKKKEGKCLDLVKNELKKVKIKGKKKKEEKKFVRCKKSALKTFDLTHNVDDVLTQHEIFKTLEHFDRKKKRVKSGKGKVTELDVNRGVGLTGKVKSKTPQRVKKKRTKKGEGSVKGLGLGLGVGGEGEVMGKRNEAAVRIQRWYRKIIKKRKETPTACPDFDESLIIKSVHRRTSTLTKHKPSDSIYTLLKSDAASNDKLQSSLTLLSSGSFQTRRPRDLDIETINTPLLTCVFDSINSLSSSEGPYLPSSNSRFPAGTVKSPGNEEVKYSFQTDSLEQSIKPNADSSISNIKPADKAKLQSEDLPSTLPELKQLACYISEQDSLQSDIDISSSLIRQFEEFTSESQKNSEISDLDYKIPISTPEFSINLIEIISEVVESEVDLFESSIKFLNNELCVDPSPDFIINFLKEIFHELKKTEVEVLDIVNTPAFVDPLEKLRILQCSNIGELRKYRELDEMIPQEICEFMQEKFKGDQIWVRKVYVQMLFDCVNECFNIIRPFGRQGLPDPWVENSRLLFGEGEMKRVYKRTNGIMMNWAQLKGGTQAGIIGCADNAKLQVLREENMSKLLCFDVNDEEWAWVGYEDEETQSKNDVADMILFDLFTEVVFVLK